MFYLSAQKTAETMRILVVAATEAEVSELISEFGFVVLNSKNLEHQNQNDSDIKNLRSEVLITGVGMVATAFALGRHLATNRYQLVLNLGIAGSFNRDIPLGEVFEIEQDTFAELGAENDEEFLPIETMGFGEGTFFPSKRLADLYNLFNNFNLRKTTAITVNTVHGNEASIKKVSERLNADLESMEGAAFFYACRQLNIPCLQIRAVSNYVEKRNRDNWQIGLAIKNLNTFAIEFLKLYA